MALGMKTGGRRKGTPNKRTMEQKQVAEELIATTLGDDAFDGNAHDLLRLVYKNTTLPLQTRLDAARSAIRFETPMLSSTTLGGDKDNPVGVKVGLWNWNVVDPRAEPGAGESIPPAPEAGAI